MSKDIVIETERLILRQWNMEDINDIVEGLNNLNVTKSKATGKIEDEYITGLLKDEWIKG